jgi:hypothetical protein
MLGATRKREKQWECATFDSFCFKLCKFSGLLKIYPSVMAPAKYSYKVAYKLHLEYNMAILTGDTAVIPPGHNATVVGNEQMVGIDFTGLKDYAKEGGPQASSRLSRKGEE